MRNAKLEKEKLNKAGSKEKVELIIYGPSYDKRAANDGKTDNLKSYIDDATKNGIEVKVVTSAKDILAEASAAASDKKDPVSSLSYYGHSSNDTLLVNYGENDPDSASELITAKDITSAIPKVTKNFNAKLEGCNLGNTLAQDPGYEQDSVPSMAQDLSNFYKGSTIMGTSGKSRFGPLGQGWLSPSSEGGFNYWKNGAVIKSDPPGDIPSGVKGVRSLDLPK